MYGFSMLCTLFMKFILPPTNILSHFWLLLQLLKNITNEGNFCKICKFEKFCKVCRQQKFHIFYEKLSQFITRDFHMLNIILTVLLGNIELWKILAISQYEVEIKVDVEFGSRIKLDTAIFFLIFVNGFYMCVFNAF